MDLQPATSAPSRRQRDVKKVKNLRYWMLGLAAPGEHQWHEPGSDGVVTLEQGGWRIDYQRYSTEPGARVPVKMSASNGAARVRIVVDRWQLGQ